MNQVQEITDLILNKLPEPPHTGVILGSGLGYFIPKLQEPIYIPYDDITHYPCSTVSGHAGEWVYGYIKGKPIICASGRFHYYEGFPINEITLPVSIIHSLGCQLLLITNAAGCLKKEWELGDLMLITGYLDYTFRDNSDQPTIVPFDQNKKPRKRVIEKAMDIGIILREGIYTWTLGPSYETSAEVQDIISLGGHAVGMSTVPELIKAQKLGIDFVGISFLSNYGAGMEDSKILHKDVLDITSRVKEKFTSLMLKII